MIGFFDGFSWKLVGISYGVFIGLAIIVEVVNCYLRKRQSDVQEPSNPGQINASDLNAAGNDQRLNYTDNSVS